MSYSPDLFKVRVGVVVLDADNRLLLVSQNHNPFWVLPGGTLEKGESISDCAIREIKEEANLNIALEALLYVSDFHPPGRHETVDLVFKGRLLGGMLERETTQNIDEIQFFTLEAVKAMACKPDIVFQKLLQDWTNQDWSPKGYLGLSS